jgi:hypothetical protein
MAKSTLMGFGGIVIAWIGIMLLLAGIVSASAGTVLGILGISASGIVSLGIFDIIIGVIATWFGFRMLFANETGVIKMLIGISGILLVLIGLIVGLGTFETVVGILVCLVILSMGIAFVSYGFNIHIWKPLDKLMGYMKKLMTVKILGK